MSDRFFRVRVLDVDVDEARFRLRVLLCHYEGSWGQDVLPTEDPGFFFRVLWEGENGEADRPGRGPRRNDLATLEQFCDPDWGVANADRFVRRVRRLAVRNHPVDADLAELYLRHWDSLDALLYPSPALVEQRPAESGLAQADYDVWVADRRWLARLRGGQEWATDAYLTPRAPGAATDVEAGDDAAPVAARPAGGPVTAAGVACLRLGGMRCENPEDLDGAAAAYRRAVELGDPRTAVQAMLDLDELPGRRGGNIPADEPFPGRVAREARAALELCFRLHADGRPDEARAAYQLALRLGDKREVAGEAWRRAGIEPPAVHCLRLARRGERAAAAAELRWVYEPHDSAARFGLAVYAGDHDAAAAVLERIGGDLEERHLVEIATDLAFHYARESDDAAVEAVLRLAERLEFAGGGLGYAIDSGSAHPLEAVRTVGRRLAESQGPTDYDAYATKEYDWCRKEYWTCVRELGGIEAADWAVLRLGRALHGIGDPNAARAVYAVVRELGRPAAADRAVLWLCRLLDQIDDANAEFNAGAPREELATRLDPHGKPPVRPETESALARINEGTSTTSDLDILEEELTRRHGPPADGDTLAVTRYADWLDARSGGRNPRAREVRRTIAEGAG